MAHFFHQNYRIIASGKFDRAISAWRVNVSVKPQSHNTINRSIHLLPVEKTFVTCGDAEKFGIEAAARWIDRVVAREL